MGDHTKGFDDRCASHRRGRRTGDLSRFRERFHQCLAARADALFELTDAALCADGPVTSLVELSLTPEHRRGHGTLYQALNQGRIDTDRFRGIVARQPIPRDNDGRIMPAIDISHWLRPDADTSP
nr:transposase [Saccharothrix coeruleofusca]